MAPKDTPSLSAKRKLATDASQAARKRTKIYDARTLAVQSSDAALSKTGELDVSAFVAAREFEIRALEAGIRNSRTVLSSRAFQKVPRNLRRRTASHNVKRVPKRLRARAKREMIEDNTATVTARRRKPTEQLRLRLETARRLQGLNARSKAKRAERAAAKAASKLPTDASPHDVNIAPRVPKIKKNKLSHPAEPPSKFKKRQRAKTWLPTHMFHAKRAHLTDHKEPLWRFAIPLSPTEKCYRPTHRAGGARGAIAWDMSYISTIGLEGRESSLEGLLRSLGVDGEEAWGAKGRKWRAGTRSLEAWVFERDGDKRLVAPVTLIWCGMEKQEDVEMAGVGATNPKKPPSRRMFLRVHPSAFLQVWEEILKVSKMQRPQVMAEDLRFEIGSIDVIGPSAIEALLAALKPVPKSDGDKLPQGSSEAVWPLLSGLTNVASLPQSALLAFNISDPRLHFPPRTIKPPTSDDEFNNLATLLSSWPPDSSHLKPDLFSRPARLTASRLLPSQKAINRRKTLAGPGQYPVPKDTDPHIPVIIYASRPRTLSKNSGQQGTMTVLLPWKCVVPVWYSIMYYPLSSGGNPRFGGLVEHQQLAFERGEPWFPGDFPGTKAGWEWELRERERQKEEWERKPKGKRVEYDSIVLSAGQKGEIGHGWACDWERLVPQPQAEQSTEIEGGSDSEMQDKDKTKRRRRKPADPASMVPPFGIHQLSASAALCLVSRKPKSGSPTSPAQSLHGEHALTTVKITVLGRGTPTPRARIYRLPTTDPVLREQWLSLLEDTLSPNGKSSSRKNPRNNKHRKGPIDPNPLIDALDTDEPIHLPIPAEEDLIGFGTTGNYNLSAGKGTGIGAVLLHKVGSYNLPVSPVVGEENTTNGGHAQAISTRKNVAALGKEKLMRTCIVRTSGERLGRLAFWEVV
ncbi:hypothetical protein AJ80_01874 [Polytolypa hystricis UAMH7299]|uniref:Uncharacterized protein n=1 Tax=Polytolypa hystricis (strain UAMH7299) TaxID=1447883 RepID=A0A2B7YXJ5_POLH7|nr:hypothetical protein AJ80_01874 [Polytolypa hystricis UAMH7299]